MNTDPYFLFPQPDTGLPPPKPVTSNSTPTPPPRPTPGPSTRATPRSAGFSESAGRTSTGSPQTDCSAAPVSKSSTPCGGAGSGTSPASARSWRATSKGRASKRVIHPREGIGTFQSSGTPIPHPAPGLTVHEKTFKIMNDILELKWRLPLPDLLKQIGLGAHAKRSAPCPLHEDKKSSFSMFQTVHGWRFKCHAGCGEGDEIIFLEKWRGLLRGEAIRFYANLVFAPGSWGFDTRPTISRNPVHGGPCEVPSSGAKGGVKIILPADVHEGTRETRKLGKLGVSVRFLSDTGCRYHLRLLKLLDSCVRSKWGETERFAQELDKSLHFLKEFVPSFVCSPFDNSGKPCNRWPIAATAFSLLPTSLLRFRSADNFLSSSRGQPKPAFFGVCAREFISIRFGITRRDICFSMQRPD
jgi:hypothetical protein